MATSNVKNAAVKGPSETQHQQESLLPLILVALFVCILTLVWFLRRGRKTSRAVLIVGPCDAGKTALFSRLVGGSVPQTVTSLIPNQLEYRLKNGREPLLLKDLPGHQRVHVKYWDEHKQNARGVICVVDAASGNRGIRESADILFRILTDAGRVAPNILVLANKQDQAMAKSADGIKLQLEKELTTLRMTKSASLVGTSGASGKNVAVLGKPDKDFEFSHLSNCTLDFADCCAVGKNIEDIQDVCNWLEKIS